MRRILIATCMLMGGAVILPSSIARARALEPTGRTVYVSVVDNKGVPVGDLSAADFTVKENGKEYPVEKVEVARSPMQVAIVVDDNGTGAFRAGVASLVQGLLPMQAEFQIMTVLRQVTRVTEFTSNVELLRPAITGLISRPGAQDGSYLVDGLLEAVKDLDKKKAARPVVVAFTVGAGDKSLSSSSDVLRQLKQTMTSLHVLALGNAMVSEAASSAMDVVNVNQVLDEGPKQSGGRRHALTGVPQVADAVTRVVDQLTKQYALTYTLPDGVKKHERLQVQVKRSGTTVMAPTKIADR